MRSLDTAGKYTHTSCLSDFLGFLGKTLRRPVGKGLAIGYYGLSGAFCLGLPEIIFRNAVFDLLPPPSQ